MSSRSMRPTGSDAGDPFHLAATDTLSLADLLDALLARKWLIASTTVVFAAGAVALAFLLPPVYRSSAVVLPSQSSAGGLVSEITGQFSGLASLAGIRPGGSSDSARLVAVLRSRRLAERFIAENELLPELFHDRWDEQRGRWKEGVEVPTLDDGYFLFDKTVRNVSEDPRSGLVTLSMSWTDRQLAAAWANGLVALANRTERQRAIEEAEASIEYLNRELEHSTAQEVRLSIFSLIESNLKLKVMARVEEDYAFEIIDPAAVVDEKRRSSPKRKLIVAVGTILGFAVGAAFALFSLRPQANPSSDHLDPAHDA